MMGSPGETFAEWRDWAMGFICLSGLTQRRVAQGINGAQTNTGLTRRFIFRAAHVLSGLHKMVGLALQHRGAARSPLP